MANEHASRHTQWRAVQFGYLGLMSLAMASMISDKLFVSIETWKKRGIAHTCTTWQVIAASAISKSPTTAKLLNATNVRKYGQLIAMPSDMTVNLSHDFTLWRVDRVTSWLVLSPGHIVLHGDPATPPKRGTAPPPPSQKKGHSPSPQFSARVKYRDAPMGRDTLGSL